MDPKLSSSVQAVFSLFRESKLNLDLIRTSIASNPSCLVAQNDGDSYTLLHVAARRGVMSLVKLLVEAGSCLDALAVHGETPFLVACHNGHLQVVHILADAGCNIHICDNYGRNSVHYAASVGCVPVLHYLIEVLHQDINSKDKLGDTALHIAVKERVSPSRTYLLKKKCDRTLSNDKGMTPVHIAAKNGSALIMWNLLCDDINCKYVLSLRDVDGHTPIDLAIKGQNSSHKTLAWQLPWWSSHPHLMKKIPWLYWTKHSFTPGTFMIIAALCFCYIPHYALAFIVGVLFAAAGYVFPTRPIRISHHSMWPNPAIMGVVITEIPHQCMSYLFRVLPGELLTWPHQLFVFSGLIINFCLALYLFVKLKMTDPGTDTVGKIGPDGKLLTILDVAKEDRNFTSFQLRSEQDKPVSSVLQFCANCLIVIPDHTKHCKLCIKCCNGFDHHCTWLNSCIGYNNHRLFVIFIISLTLEVVLYFVDAIYALILIYGNDFPLRIFSKENYYTESWLKLRFLIAIFVLLYCVMVLREQLLHISKGETVYFDNLGKASYGTQRYNNLSLRARLGLVWLFFKDYEQWFHTKNTSMANSRLSSKEYTV